MSKGQKKKVTVKIIPGEAVFVAPIEMLQHISDTYMHLSTQADTTEESDSWSAVSDHINEWISKTYYSGQENYEEEW